MSVWHSELLRDLPESKGPRVQGFPRVQGSKGPRVHKGPRVQGSRGLRVPLAFILGSSSAFSRGPLGFFLVRIFYCFFPFMFCFKAFGLIKTRLKRMEIIKKDNNEKPKKLSQMN